MAATAGEFLELIGQEVQVDMPRLRRLAFYGCPQQVRPQVWKLLLSSLDRAAVGPRQRHRHAIDNLLVGGVADDADNGQIEDLPDLETHLLLSSAKDDGGDEEAVSDSELLRMIRSEIHRCHHYVRGVDFFQQPRVKNSIERILLEYFRDDPTSTSIFRDDPAIVHLLCPFVFAFRRVSDAHECFSQLVQLLQIEATASHRKNELAKFLMLFRSRLPELYTHFEEEDIEHTRWAVSWMRWLLCREMSLECCLRLWDSYFAYAGSGFDLHLYVCLAILEFFSSDLLELEFPEIMHFLRHVPRNLDMDKIIHHAQCMALEHQP